MKHILIIFTDQMRYDAIRALGNPAIQTPNLDALADDSVVFRNCVTPSPVCVPARHSLYTGQYCARTGCNNNNSESQYKGEGFYSRLTKAGFKSCCVGKMHHEIDPYGPLGFEKRISQEEFADSRDDYTKFIMENYPHVYDYHGMRSEMYYVPQISPLPAKDHPTQWIGDQSVEYINSCNPEEPMFLFTSFIHPHPPFCPPAPWNKLYREDPPAPHCPDKEDLEDYWEILGDRCSLRRLMMSEQDVLRMKNFYYACISFMDCQVGRMIKALKEKGMYEDTLILFTSDHGDMMGDYQVTGKRTMMDSSCRIPFICHYPGKGHEERRDICSLVDVAPTLLKFAEAAYDPAEFDGINLFGGEHHDHVYSQYGCGDDGTYMVTDGVNKLVHRMKSDRYFYFRTEEKERDTKNIYDPEVPEVKTLKKLLDAYQQSDVNKSKTSETHEPTTKTHPHYVARIDHALRHDEEAAEIPEGYVIDLG
ncbi:MAG: sulfatase-like hydrolase/transferase [Hungatella sp.]|nr:sulfatase-like hydrolase/transferase [Hungatella sp.]